MQIYFDTNGQTYAYTYHQGARAYLTRLATGQKAYFSYCRDRALAFPSPTAAKNLIYTGGSRHE